MPKIPCSVFATVYFFGYAYITIKQRNDNLSLKCKFCICDKCSQGRTAFITQLGLLLVQSIKILDSPIQYEDPPPPKSRHIHNSFNKRLTNATWNNWVHFGPKSRIMRRNATAFRWFRSGWNFMWWYGPPTYKFGLRVAGSNFPIIYRNASSSLKLLDHYHRTATNIDYAMVYGILQLGLV